jgi:hypothetical protein
VKGARPAVVAGIPLAAAAIIVLVVVLARDDGPGGETTTTSTGPTPTTGTAPVPPEAPPDLPAWGDFPGAPAELDVPAGGAAAIAPTPGGQEVTLERADGSPAAVVTLGPGGAPLDARFFDPSGRLTLVVSALRAAPAGAAGARARVRCGSAARADAGFRWTRFPVRWRLSTGASPSGLRRAATLLAIRRARGTWNANRTHCAGVRDLSRARFAFAGSSPRRVGRDGVSVVDVGDINRLGGICPGAVACTITWIAGGNRASESDTRIRRSDPGGFSTARRPGPRKLDLQSVMVHESGHTLGFAHVTARDVVMNPIVRRGDVSGRRLGRGDALASNAKY